MEIVGNDAQFNGKVTLLKDLEIYGNIKNKTKDTSFDFSDNFSFKIQGNEKLRITSGGTTFTDTVISPNGIFSDSITVPNVSAQTVIATEYYGTFKGSIDPSVADDKITEGNSSAEVVDTGSNGHFKVLTAGTEKFRILSDGKVGIGTTNPFGMIEVQKNGVPAIISNYNNSKHIQMDAGDSGAGIQISTGHYFAINHQPYADRGTTNNLTERLRIASAGQIGIAGANYGTTGQVLTSQGSSSAVQWTSTAAKAYVNFDGTSAGTNKTIRDSHNVSSVVDNGTGDYTINFSTAFANTNYVITVGHSNANNNGSTHGVLYTNTITTGSVQVMNFADDSGGNLVDKTMVSVVIHAT